MPPSPSPRSRCRRIMPALGELRCRCPLICPTPALLTTGAGIQYCSPWFLAGRTTTQAARTRLVLCIYDTSYPSSYWRPIAEDSKQDFPAWSSHNRFLIFPYSSRLLHPADLSSPFTYSFPYIPLSLSLSSHFKNTSDNGFASVV